jgi:pilus assembly protein Flp/PilA
MIRKIRNLLRNKQGQGLVEYALLIAGVALISAAAVSVFGHKTSDLIGSVTAVLPGAHSDDNAPIVSGKLIETAPNADGNIALDTTSIVANTNSARLGNNVLGGEGSTNDGFVGLVKEANEEVTP